MKNLILTVAIIAAPLAAATPAFAADGLYVSGGINATSQSSFSSRNTGSNQPNTGAAGGSSGTVTDKDTGIGFVGGIGYKKHVTPDFFVSAEGFFHLRRRPALWREHYGQSRYLRSYRRNSA